MAEPEDFGFEEDVPVGSDDLGFSPDDIAGQIGQKAAQGELLPGALADQYNLSPAQEKKLLGMEKEKVQRFADMMAKQKPITTPSDREGIGAGRTFAMEAADTLTMQNLPWLSGKIGQMMGMDEIETRKAVRDDMAQGRKQNPKAAKAGTAVGIVGSVAGLGRAAGALTKGLKAGAKTASLAGEGALLGAAAEQDQKETGADYLEGALSGAAIGAAFPAALRSAGKLATKTAAGLDQKVYQQTQEAIKRRMAQLGQNTKQIRQAAEKAYTPQEAVNTLKKYGVFGEAKAMGLRGTKTAFQQADTLKKAVNTKRDEIRSVLKQASDVSKASGETVGKIEVNDLIEELDQMAFSDPNPQQSNAYAAQANRLAKMFGKNKTLSLEEAQKIKNHLNDGYARATRQLDSGTDAAFSAKAQLDYGKALSNKMRDAVGQVDPVLKQKYAAAQKDFSILKDFVDSSEDLATKAAIKPTLGEKALERAGTLATGGIPVGGAPGGLKGRVAQYTTSKMERFIEAAPKRSKEWAKWGDRLTSAMDKGRDAYASQVFLLYSSEPEFRKFYNSVKEK